MTKQTFEQWNEDLERRLAWVKGCYEDPDEDWRRRNFEAGLTADEAVSQHLEVTPLIDPDFYLG